MIESNMLGAAQEKAELFYAANKEKNAASTVERKHQKELDYLMSNMYDGAAGSFEHTFKYNDKTVSVDVTYGAEIRDSIDATRLYEEVGLETFLKCCSVSKAKVEQICGKNVANMVTSSTETTWKTRVKERK